MFADEKRQDKQQGKSIGSGRKAYQTLRVFARVLPQLKRVVFVAEGKFFDLLRHQVKVYRSSQQVL
jgi:hypothetical protein